ncbi:gamma-mobile-trio protein GmtX [Pseudomonas sp. BP01]|uniref:gamma-mobile-trio protein GmtX n=1 Tax=Pseudomonas sp. BP01 TaxID=2976152 RepID=UPI001FAA82A8|nr:gamma-mobile-trio protein GmtX [Pseudomonas sp. BP01]
MIDPQLIFEELSTQATKQQARSLAVLHAVLKSHEKTGSRNFSIATIARLSVKAGGPSVSTIRNAGGFRFRQLIEAWAASAGTDRKFPGKPKLTGIPSDNELVRRIDDPALRAVFTQVLAERRRYLAELNILKSQQMVVIDRRPNVMQTSSARESVQLLPSLKGVLSGMEIAALSAAVSDDFFDAQGWRVTGAGQVKGESGEIYKHGYVVAIRKILKEIERLE